jgi:hypothetical protein
MSDTSGWFWTSYMLGVVGSHNSGHSREESRGWCAVCRWPVAA